MHDHPPASIDDWGAARAAKHAEGQLHGLAIEALDVAVSRDEAAIVIPLVRREVPVGRRDSRSAEAWLDDLARDPDGVWRSPWLALCATDAQAARS